MFRMLNCRKACNKIATPLDSGQLRPATFHDKYVSVLGVVVLENKYVIEDPNILSQWAGGLEVKEEDGVCESSVEGGIREL